MNPLGIVGRLLPVRVGHADRSNHLSWRWFARAGRTWPGDRILSRPEPRGEPGTLMHRERKGQRGAALVLVRWEVARGANAVVRIEGWTFGEPVP